MWPSSNFRTDIRPKHGNECLAAPTPQEGPFRFVACLNCAVIGVPTKDLATPRRSDGAASLELKCEDMSVIIMLLRRGFDYQDTGY